MNFEDVIVDGVRIADTDFTRFTRLCQLTAWENRTREAARLVYGEDKRKRFDFGSYRCDLVADLRERLIDDSRAREPNCPPRNLDLKVVRTFPKEWTAEDIAASPDSCVIGLNDGRSPNEIVWDDFQDAEEMTNYEFAAYAILGDDECDRQGIDTLHDMFGTEFAERFYRRKRQLIAKFQLGELYEEREKLNERIAKLEVEARG